MEEIISNIINNFDWSYMLAINVLTYGINKLLDTGVIHKTPSWIKKFITILVGAGLGLLYIYIDETVSARILLNSAILAPVSWDFVFKPIFNKLGIDYKNKLNLNKD